MRIKLGTYFYSPYKYAPLPAIELAPPLFMYHIGRELIPMWANIRKELKETVFIAHFPYYALEPSLVEKIANLMAPIRPDAVVAFATFPSGLSQDQREEVLRKDVGILTSVTGARAVSLKHPRPNENLSFAQIIEWSERIPGLIPDIFINSMYGRAFNVLGNDRKMIEEELIDTISVMLEVSAEKNSFAVVHYSPFIVGPGNFTYTQTGNLNDTVLAPEDVGILLKEAEETATRLPEYTVFIYNNRYESIEERLRDLRKIARALRIAGHEVEL